MDILTMGQKIRNRRKQLNMTLKELAGDKVTAGQLSFVELGKSNPSGELVQYIADKLGVTVDYLLETEMSQAQRICEYNIKLAKAYIYDKKFEEAKMMIDNIVGIAKHYKLHRLMGMAELGKGKIAFNSNEYEKAICYFLNANQYFLKDDYYLGAIITYIELGQTALNSSFSSLALSYFKQAELLCSEKGVLDEQLVSQIYFNICMCEIKLGHWDEVERYLPKVEIYLDSVSDERQYADSLLTISQTYRDTRDYEKALYYANKSLDIYKKLEDEESIARMKMNLGIIYREKSDIEKSNHYLRDCEKMEYILGHKDMSCVLLRLAWNCIEQKDFKSAASYVEKCFKLAVKNKNINCQIECYNCLYEIYNINKNYKECESVLKNKLSLLESLDKPKELAECYMKIGEYYNLVGEKHMAVEYISKSFKVLDDLRKENIV